MDAAHARASQSTLASSASATAATNASDEPMYEGDNASTRGLLDRIRLYQDANLWVEISQPEAAP